MRLKSHCFDDSEWTRVDWAGRYPHLKAKTPPSSRLLSNIIWAQGTHSAKLGCGSSVLGTIDRHQICTMARERAQAMLSRAERTSCPSCFSRPGSTRLLPDSEPSLVYFHCLSLSAACPGPWGNKTLLLLQYLRVALSPEFSCLRTNWMLPKVWSQMANKTSQLWG